MGVDTRCDAGICADDTGPGALFQSCSQDADCSAVGLACGNAQDGQMRCLRMGELGSACSYKLDWWGISGIAETMCPAGASCVRDADGGESRSGPIEGSCGDVVGATAGFGEVCGPDNEGGSTLCADTDGEGNRLVCDVNDSEDPQGTRLRRCFRRLRNGESCATENAICDASDNFRRAGCNSDNNLCEVSADALCNDDSDCDTEDGESCVSGGSGGTWGSPQQFICAKFNQQLGKECQKQAPPFGNIWTIKCSENLTCFNPFPGSWDVTGICVSLVGAGQQCNEAENIACDDGNACLDACLDGTCQSL